MSGINWTEAQRQAIEAERCSLAVSAAAGSGKTAVLTRRIIERICSGKADLSRMLVVTFTRAAAAELVSRIGEELSAESAKNPGDRNITRQLLLLPSAKICTIDSFCLDLIRENFPDTGVSGFGVLDAEAEKILKKEIMDELVTDYFNGNVTGENKIENFGDFADTFGAPTNDGQLILTAIRLYDYYGNAVDMKSAIKGGNPGDGEEFSSTPWGKTVYKYAGELFSHYEKLLGDAVNVIGSSEGCGGWLEGFAADVRYAVFAGEKLKNGTEYPELRKFLFDYDSYRVSRLGAVKSEYKTPELEYYKKRRDDFRTAVKSLATTFFAYDGNTIKELTEKTLSMQNKMCAFLSEYDKYLISEKKRRKVMGFSDIERYALNLLYDYENKCPSAAAKETAERFDEIYIDEYQDTNEVQDLIFNLISREDNRFTVGDVKQSIYEFRGAEPMIFTRQLDGREKYNYGKEQKQVKLFLSENFRSTQEILSFVNTVFGKLMNAGAEKRYGDDERLNCGRNDYHGPIPEMHIVCRSDDDGEVREEKFVAQKISEIINSGGAKPGDIAVLLLTKTSAYKFEEALSEYGIPCKNTAAAEFFSNAEVLLALSILNTVDNPGRDVYLAGALKSPVYGVTLDELIYIRRFKKDGTLFSALKAFTEATGFKKGEKFLSDHKKFRGYAKISSCGELVRKIYGDTQIMSLAAIGKSEGEVEEARANLQRLYDYARSFESSGDKGLYAFISFIDELTESGAKIDISQFSPSSDSVCITTIHGSKGLEYDVCFLCDTTHEFYKRESAEDITESRTLPLSMRITDGESKLETPMRSAVLLNTLDRKTDEFLRTLYVALTRAKKRLIITAEVKDEESAREKYDYNKDGECVLAGKYFSSYARQKSKCFLELLCLSLAENPESCQLDFVTEISRLETKSEKEKAYDDMTYAEAKRLVFQRLDFEYPYAALSGVPSKLSVSKLYPDVLDPEPETVSEPDMSIAEPVFLRGSEPEADAADKGTAMHIFMQFFDFDYVDKNGVDGEIKRLAENKFIFPDDVTKLDAAKLEKFFASPLAKQMRTSKTIFREKRFIIYYPAKDFAEDEKTKAALNDEKLLVQGVIDCAFVNDKNELILVDYKTDSFPGDFSEKRICSILKNRHKRQLGYYKYACIQLFARPADRTYIYSFALDKAIEI